jgi:hypothetical protein
MGASFEAPRKRDDGSDVRDSSDRVAEGAEIEVAEITPRGMCRWRGFAKYRVQKLSLW